MMTATSWAKNQDNIQNTMQDSQLLNSAYCLKMYEHYISVSENPRRLISFVTLLKTHALFRVLPVCLHLQTNIGQLHHSQPLWALVFYQFSTGPLPYLSSPVACIPDCNKIMASQRIINIPLSKF
jgi:hypothetical protein